MIVGAGDSRACLHRVDGQWSSRLPVVGAVLRRRNKWKVSTSYEESYIKAVQI